LKIRLKDTLEVAATIDDVKFPHTQCFEIWPEHSEHLILCS